MGATEGILNPIRLSNTLPRVILVLITGMRKCERLQMQLLLAKCSDGLTVLKTNTLTTQVTPEPRLSTHTGPKNGMEEPVFLHKNTCTTTAHFMAPIHIQTPARHQTHLTSIRMTGLSTSALLERSTTTTAGLRSHSGRNPKSGWRESRGRKRSLRLQL